MGCLDGSGSTKGLTRPVAPSCPRRSTLRRTLPRTASSDSVAPRRRHGGEDSTCGAGFRVDSGTRPPQSRLVNTVHLTARLRSDIVARLDAIASAMTAATPGAEMGRADALRAVLADGLPITERRYGLAADASQKGAKPARKPK